MVLPFASLFINGFAVWKLFMGPFLALFYWLLLNRMHRNKSSDREQLHLKARKSASDHDLVEDKKILYLVMVCVWGCIVQFYTTWAGLEKNILLDMEMG